jgi:hypothetical protein
MLARADLRQIPNRDRTSTNQKNKHASVSVSYEADDDIMAVVVRTPYLRNVLAGQCVLRVQVVEARVGHALTNHIGVHLATRHQAAQLNITIRESRVQ